MKKHCMNIIGICLALILFAGCSKVYWDEDWQYQGTDPNVIRTQKIALDTVPSGAYVFVGEERELTGRTPLFISLEYRVVKTELVKRQYEEKSGGARTVLDTQVKPIETNVPAPHIITLTKDRYNDETRTLIVPLDKGKVIIPLHESGVIEDIACTLTIEARKEYFREIDRVIGPYAGADRVLGVEEKTEITPEDAKLETEGSEIRRLNEQGIRIFQYNIEVDDSRKYGDMVSGLRGLAKTRNFVFEIYNAEHGAKFTTNVLESGIKHLITGRRRTGARLYLAQSGRLKRIPETDFTMDRFQTEVVLKPGEREVYLISAFKKGKAVLLVYKHLDVFAQTEEEIEKEEDFIDMSRVKPSEIEKIRTSFKQDQTPGN
jgi:hypothetical protein